METIVKIPKHTAIILDGNGRWATEKGLKRTEGHKAGYENLLKLSKYILSTGTKYLSVFAFSTENFKRPIDEVNYLMNLFIKGFKRDSKYFMKENIQVVFSGRRDKLSQDVLNAMDSLEEMTKENDLGILNICLNYGSRSEIIDATKKIVNEVENGKLNIDEINEEMYHKRNSIHIFILRIIKFHRIDSFFISFQSYYYFSFSSHIINILQFSL